MNRGHCTLEKYDIFAFPKKYVPILAMSSLFIIKKEIDYTFIICIYLPQFRSYIIFLKIIINPTAQHQARPENTVHNCSRVLQWWKWA